MATDLLILIVCGIAITLLGLLIFVRNPANTTNRRFALLSAALVVWTLSNYLSDHATSHILLYTRLTFFGGVATAYTLVAFIANFPSQTAFKKNIFLRIQAIATIILLPAAFTPVFVSSVVIDSSGRGTINTSYLYNLFLIYVIYTLVLLVFVMRKQHKAAKTYLQRQQIQFISWGIILYAVLAIVSNVVLPLVVNDWSSSRFGPAFTLFLVVMVAYTVVKHKLFDIRLIVARSAAYVLSLGFITVIFSIMIFGVAGLAAESNYPKSLQRLFYVIVTIVLVLAYPYMKRYFDRLTNKLFYRDAYEPQLFYNDLNRVLVSSIDLNLILKNSAKVIEQNIKPIYARFEIYEKEGSKVRRVSAVGSGEDSASFSIAEDKLVSASKYKVLVADELEETDAVLKNTLSNNNIAVVARLIGSTQKDDAIAYLVLGPKKTGNIYNSLDIKVLEIISDELAIAVQNALRFEEIQQFNVTLQDKVDDATHQLRKANDRLRALDETKDEFISMASHQLRTPLTTVKGYVSMVLEGDAGKVSGPQRKLLDQSFLSAQRMVYLIADLLNVSRLRTGKFIIDSVPTNLADLVEGEIEQLKETAKSRNLELSYDKPKNFPMLMLDETKIRQVVMNFADNAIYYTPSGGHIHISVEDKGETIEFKVVDDGIGVPKHTQHHLFGKFYRADNAKKARPDGTGLGLFMAKKVVVAQGGAIIFSSEEGKGSTFGFTFAKDKLKVPANIKANPKEVAKESKEAGLL